MARSASGEFTSPSRSVSDRRPTDSTVSHENRPSIDDRDPEGVR
ncbi:hypothetical protein ACFQL0_08265 [Haloplanus litoreus]